MLLPIQIRDIVEFNGHKAKEDHNHCFRIVKIQSLVRTTSLLLDKFKLGQLRSFVNYRDKLFSSKRVQVTSDR